MSKAILYILSSDVQLAAGPLQVCAGHEAGSEAAVHAISIIFKDDHTENVLSVDTTNAFNQLSLCISFFFCVHPFLPS